MRSALLVVALSLSPAASAYAQQQNPPAPTPDRGVQVGVTGQNTKQNCPVVLDLDHLARRDADVEHDRASGHAFDTVARDLDAVARRMVYDRLLA